MHKILIVDDDPKIVKIFEQFLAHHAFEVITAFGGKEGIEIISSGRKFDLLILDLGMPQINGSDLLMSMLDLKIKVPTIIITGSIDIEKYSYALRSVDIPQENILYKPIDLFVLLDKIKKLLRIPT